MKLQQRPITLEAVLWDGENLCEWPDWIKKAFLTVPTVVGALLMHNDPISYQFLFISNGPNEKPQPVPPGAYLVWDGERVYTSTRELLQKDFIGFDDDQAEAEAEAEAEIPAIKSKYSKRW